MKFKLFFFIFLGFVLIFIQPSNQAFSYEEREMEIWEKEMPIHISNVAAWNPINEKPDRIGFRTLEDGQKVRYFKSNNEVVDV